MSHSHACCITLDSGVAPGPTISAMFCRHCGYNLHGLPEDRCAECGREFDPKNRKSYSTHSGSLARRRWARRAVASFIALILLAGAGAFSLWWPWHRDDAAIRMVRRCAGTMDTTTVGPKWLQSMLGRRWGFLLERAGPACDLRGSKVTDADLSALMDLKELQWLNLEDTQVTDAGLKHLTNLTGLKALYLQRMQVTDAGLEHLKNLTGLKVLYLERTQVTDAGLEHLKDLKGLQWLNLDGTQVTDAGLEHLKGLKGLQALYLQRTQVTDAGLEHLKDLKRLQLLSLMGTQVTDAGLEQLKDLKGLQWLFLTNTQVTVKGIEALKRALPGCAIVR